MKIVLKTNVYKIVYTVQISQTEHWNGNVVHSHTWNVTHLRQLYVHTHYSHIRDVHIHRRLLNGRSSAPPVCSSYWSVTASSSNVRLENMTFVFCNVYPMSGSILISFSRIYETIKIEWVSKVLLIYELREIDLYWILLGIDEGVVGLFLI